MLNRSRAAVAALSGVLLAALALGYAFLPRSPAPKSMPARSLELTETARLELPPGGKSLKLWFPRPPAGPYQTVELLEVVSPWRHTVVADPDFGNEILLFEAAAPEAGPAEILLRYRLTRREQSGPDAPGGAVSPLFSKPRGLVVVNDEIRGIAREATRGLQGTVEKARALYGYVLSHMEYDTSGEGWGRGDVAHLCKVGKGNCTDFHSLFISLAMAEGIPARFRIGYPLPQAAAGPVLKPYHCWAEFHSAGRGWIPVDISEAWKNPAKAEYYFGSLDPDRVLVSTGREIRLPRQNGPALDYLVRPYAEVDGKPFTLDFKRNYKNIRTGGKT
jgi:transglutaminase-like putative cysteine protease